MGKRIVISEEEKKDIKEMYNLNEDWIDDVVGFIKKAGKKIKSYFTSKDGKDLSDDDIKKKMSDMDDKEKEEFKKEVGYKDERKSSKKEKSSESGKWVTEGRYCYYVPDGYRGYKAHLLICGNDTTASRPTNENYKSNIRKPSDMIFVMTDYKNSISAAESWINNKFDAEVTSIAGFSAGGLKVWPEAGNLSYKIIGLIDPSTPEKYSYENKFDEFGKNTVLVCNPNNWGSIPNYKSNLSEYCSHEKESKGKIICKSTSHHDQLGVFYSRFSSNL
jgi:hypothetical protein